MHSSKTSSVGSVANSSMDSTTEIVPKKGKENKFFVYFLACFASLGGCLFGYDTGIVSGSMLLIRPHFNLSTLWSELIVSGTIGAAAIFALFAGQTTDYIGRKKTIMLASFVFTVGAFVMGAAPTKEVLLIGRIIVGMGIGFASMTVPMYVAEAAPSDIRGRLVTLNQLFITIGIVVSAIIAGAFSLIKNDGWRYMLGLAAVPGVIQFFGFFFLPESPRWLVEKGRIEEAKKVLIKIRNTNNVEAELREILETIELDRMTDRGGLTIGRIVTTPHVLKALLIGSGMQMFGQLSGINTVIYYSGSIIKMAGFPAKYAIWLVLVPNTVNFLATFIGIWLVERLGRKGLTIGSFAGVVLSLIVLAVGFQLSAVYSPPINTSLTELYDNGTAVTDECAQYSICEGCINNKDCGFCYDNRTDGTCLMPSSDDDLKETQSEYGRCNDTEHTGFTFTVGYCPTDYSWMAILGLALFLLAFAPGIGPMAWTITSEIFPLWARGTCISITTAINWVFNLIVSFTFLTLTETITRYGTFWLFAGTSLLGLIFTISFIPETKGKTLEEVERLFMSESAKKERKDQEWARQKSSEKLGHISHDNTKL